MLTRTSGSLSSKPGTPCAAEGPTRGRSNSPRPSAGRGMRQRRQRGRERELGPGFGGGEVDAGDLEVAPAVGAGRGEVVTVDREPERHATVVGGDQADRAGGRGPGQGGGEHQGRERRPRGA